MLIDAEELPFIDYCHGVYDYMEVLEPEGRGLVEYVYYLFEQKD